MKATKLQLLPELNGPATGLDAVMRLPVAQAGRWAAKVLRTPVPGRVAHVFERSFYLVNNRGEMACVGEPAIGAGPLNALLAGHRPTPSWQVLLQPGQPYTFRSGEVWFGNRLVLCVRDALLWRPPIPAKALDLRLLKRHLRDLRRVARRWAPSEGLGFLVTERPPPLADSLNGKFAAQAVRGVIPLRRWLAGFLPEPKPGGHSQPPATAAALLGLGPGLTPSGDDMICGLLLALHALGRPSAAQAVSHWALPLARLRCSPLSVAHLSAAAEGEGALALHELLQGLGRDASWRAEPHTRALGGHGHTSGWDALSGVWLATGVIAATASGESEFYYA